MSASARTSKNPCNGSKSLFCGGLIRPKSRDNIRFISDFRSFIGLHASSSRFSFAVKYHKRSLIECH